MKMISSNNLKQSANKMMEHKKISRNISKSLAKSCDFHHELQTSSLDEPTERKNGKNLFIVIKCVTFRSVKQKVFF